MYVMLYFLRHIFSARLKPIHSEISILSVMVEVNFEGCNGNIQTNRSKAG